MELLLQKKVVPTCFQHSTGVPEKNLQFTGSELKEKMSRKKSPTVSIKWIRFNISMKRDAEIKDRPEIAQ